MHFVLRTCPVNYLQMVDDVICDCTSHRLDASFQNGIHTYMYVLIFLNILVQNAIPVQYCATVCRYRSRPVLSQCVVDKNW